MGTTSLEEQLVAALRDAHALEQMALAQLERAPTIAGEDALQLALRDHHVETRAHERLVRERLEAHGGRSSTLHELAAEAGGAGFVLFARAQTDTPGKLAAYVFAYEHLEVAAYELLARLAELAGDHETAVVAHRVRGEEAAMAARVAATFPRTAAAAREAGVRDDATARLARCLDDAHAVELQGATLLERAIERAGDPQLAGAFRDHLGETRDHLAVLEELIARADGGPSRLKDAALRLGARNVGALLRARTDTAGKLVAFAYAYEHLEIAGYKQLRHVAQTAGDDEAAEAAARIAGDERAAAETLHALFDVAVDASLAEAGARG